MNVINASEVALRAMKRAANVARACAKRYGVTVAIWKDNNVVLLDPVPENVQQDGAAQPAAIENLKPE